MPAKAKVLRAPGPKNATVNLRIQAAARDVIDRAAATLGKSRTDFMVEAARREAETVLTDRCYFTLDPDAFRAFTAALDKPPAENPRLRRLLTTPAPWEV
jgi:uncharacterized protein (DUF1778 family)